jgi:predicted Mrr-cat superfamily restriction endonuclease
MSCGISWKEFEALVARLQRAFNKTAKVICNEKIPGKRSGRVRQIDISIRTKIGTENVLMIVECRMRNRKIDVQAVEAFAGVMNDVGARTGIMVSTSGFTGVGAG